MWLRRMVKDRHGRTCRAGRHSCSPSGEGAGAAAMSSGDDIYDEEQLAEIELLGELLDLAAGDATAEQLDHALGVPRKEGPPAGPHPPFPRLVNLLRPNLLARG